ncbi:MAG: hypothetical protein H7Y04_15810 [Verrucomicrobia bacterium]|nr:hypothetical protein [Cytophagales bacterium]
MANFQGAGGSKGGTSKFFIGLLMFVAGIWMLMSSVYVSNGFSMSYPVFRVGNFGITSGFMMIPFMIGIGMIFFNSRNFAGWLLALGTLALLLLGIITSIHFSLRTMTLPELCLMLILIAGGLGLFLNSLRSSR